MLQLKRWLITLFLLFLVVAGLGFTKYTQVMAAIAFGESFPEPSETVHTQVAVASSWRPSIEVIGEVKAMQTLEVRNELEGVITEILLPSGGEVKEGQLLIQIDTSEEQARLDALNAQIKLAELDVKRFAELVKTRAGSQEQLDRANAQLSVNRAEVRRLKTTINKKTIRAPFTSTTSLHEWEVGSFLSANSLVTTLIGDTSTVWVDFSLPQRYSNIELDSNINVSNRDTSDITIDAIILAVDQQINEQTRSLRVRASMPNESKKLRPGALVSVTIPVEKAQQVFELPNEALRYDTFGSFVYLIEKGENGQDRAKRRPVKLVSRESDTVIISEGLIGGEIVATVGSSKLTPGILVNQVSMPK